MALCQPPSQRLGHPFRKLFSTSSDLGSPSSLYDHFRRVMVVVVFFGDAIHSHFPFSFPQLKISGEGNPLKKVSRERVKYFAPPPMTHFKVRFAVAAAVPDIGSAASHRELTPSGHPSPSNRLPEVRNVFLSHSRNLAQTSPLLK